MSKLRQLKQNNRLAIEKLIGDLNGVTREAFADVCYDIVYDHPHQNIGAEYSEDWSFNQWSLSTSMKDDGLRPANAHGFESFKSIDRNKYKYVFGKNMYFLNPVEYVPVLEEKRISKSAPEGFIEKNLPKFDEYFRKHAQKRGM